MLSTGGRLAGAALLVATAVIAWPPTVAVAEPWGDAQCGDQPRPGCDVSAGDPGSPSPVRPGRSGGSRDTCRDRAGRQAPCYDSNAGHMSSDGCYYQPADVDAATEKSMGGRPDGPGDWYWRTCRGDLDGTTNSRVLVWLTEAPVISPEVLARQAASRLDLPVVRVGSSPSGEKLVRLPVWLWVERSSWAPRSATASVPGLSVTARAEPRRAVWRMGDGSAVVCRAAGTRWRGGMNPRASSPDCGYTYRRSSAAQPRAAYVVSVTVTWAVSWSGGGRSGTLPALSTSTSTRFRVGESQAVITG